MNLLQWLEKIESFHPDEIELGLDRVSLLAKHLDLLTPTAKIITVGGTNGKVSSVATLESCALQSNISVGCYTSPHLLRFNERIRLNGCDVGDSLIVEAFEAIENTRLELTDFDDSPITITFFEYTTLAALIIFKKANLDLTVLEVGLGGRLDAVNIIEPDVAIVTTIARDHESWLGRDLEQIAFEKSGIFRTGITNYVGDNKSLNLILNARPEFLSHLEVSCESIVSKLPPLISDILINPQQLLRQNVALALSAFKQLFESEFKNLNLVNTIKNIELKGRLQVVCEKPLIILDVAHNQQAAINLAFQLDSLPCKGKRYAICGMMVDKSITEFLFALDDAIDEWIFVDLPIDRAISAFELNKIALDAVTNIVSKTSQNICKSFDALKLNMNNEDQLIVLGSFITVAEILKISSTEIFRSNPSL